MQKLSHRLSGLLGVLVGFALMAPAAWLGFYCATHPQETIGLEAALFFSLIAVFGLQIALRSAWTMIRGV